MTIKNTPDELQVYFEIAMSIGSHDDLNTMLTISLLSYLRKLNLSAGIIFQHESISQDVYRLKVVHKLPLNAHLNPAYKKVVKDIPPKMTHKEFETYIKQLPLLSSLKNGTSYTIMHLPGFGILVLIKNSALISKKIITSLKSVNLKLANAALSCIHKQNVTDSEKKYRELIEQLPEMICETDLSGRITYANKFAVDKFGYSQKDLDDNFSAFDLFIPTDRQRAQMNFMDSIKNPTKIPEEYMAVSKTQEIFPVIVYTNKIILKDKIVGIRGVMVDISERKLQEEKLLNNSERLEMALLGSGAGLWDWNIETGQIFRSEGWSKMLGYKVSEIKASVNSWENLIHPDDIESVMKKLNDHLQGETQLYRTEYRIKKKNADWLWILDTGRITHYDKASKPIRAVGTQIDISERKRAEVRLESQRELLEHTLRQQEVISRISLNFNTLNNFNTQINEAIKLIGEHIHASRVYIFEDDPSGSVTSNTFEWCREGIGSQKSILQNVDYSNIPSWRKLLIKEGRIYSDNIFDLPEDIVQILEPQDIFALLVYPLSIKGEIIGFIGLDECTAKRFWKKSEIDLLQTTASIISNAYERERTKSSLLKSESQNKAILESIPDILFHISKNGLILNYKNSNKKDESPFNDEIINQNINTVFPAPGALNLMKAIKTCLKNGHARIDFVLNTNGENKDFEAELARMNENEVIVISREVSERKAYERELNAAKIKAEQANEAKNEFLANMSHEIRTPMNAILGFSESLNHQLKDKNQQKMVNTIINSGKLLLSIINDILDMAKIEAGKIRIDNQPVNIHHLVAEVEQLFVTQAQNKGLILDTIFSENLPFQFLLDQTHVRQVLVNLIGNAIKFTETGHVKIEVDYQTAIGKTQLIIAVEDTGIGIDKDNQSLIFQAFRQEDSAFTRNFGGIGLGLTIVQKMMHQMNGDVSLKSILGKGSKFTITFNDVEIFENKLDKQGESDAHEMNEVPDVTYKNASILIVDDVKLNIETIKAQLADSEIHILEAENGEIALEILKNTQPNLVLMDIRMPGMNGFELAERIKTLPLYAKTPLIAFTASVYGEKEVLFKKTKLFNDVIYKPVSKSNLNQILQKHLPFEKLDQPEKEKKASTLEIFNPEMKANASKLTRVLKEAYLENWECIKDKLVINKIEGFADGLEKEANHFHMHQLLNYSSELKQDLELFDLAAVEQKLKRFPELIQTIENLTKK